MAARGEMATFTRREVVGLGAASAVGIGGAAFGLSRALGARAQEATSDATASPHAGHGVAASPSTGTVSATPFNGVTGQPLVEPEVRASVNGVLETSLTAALGPVTVAGETVTTTVYEGSFPGPTLRAKPGDTIRVKLTNNLDAVTNLHTHGFHVSPKDNSDNIFLHIEAGQTFDYEYVLPADHSPGMYWYHPHGHGTTATQVNGGMSGVILLDGGLDEFPGIAGLTERLLVLQATQFDGDGNLVPYNSQTNVGRQRFVNGQLQPTIAIRPGETQRWRIANISSDDFYLLSLGGHQLYQIASDGNPLDQVVPRSEILVAPSERVEVLVQALTTPGNYEFRTLLWGVDYEAEPDVLLATMVIEGDAVDPAPLPTLLIPYVDLRGIPVDNVRVTTFEEPDVPPYVAIDGKQFDPDRVDQTVKLGATEEWILRNTSSHWHPFHIHVNDFMLISRDGVAIDPHGYEDTISLPPNSETVIRMRFLDYPGKFVYHCHILFHEDAGMMAVVEVVE